MRIKNDHTAEILRELAELKRAALTEMGIFCESKAKEYETAVDTGALRNSITYQVNGTDSVTIGSVKKYAVVIEFKGGINQRGKNYLRRAVLNHKDDYRRIVDRYLKA